MIPKEIFEQSIYRYFAPIMPYLTDDSVSEIMINGPQDIWIEVKGKLRQTDARFEVEDDLMSGVKNIAQYVGKTLNVMNPRMDARLPDGSRVHVVIPPCARNGVSVAIRRFGKFSLTIEKLISYGSITPDAASFLQICVNMERNMIVAGGDGLGQDESAQLHLDVDQPERADRGDRGLPGAPASAAACPDARGEGAGLEGSRQGVDRAPVPLGDAAASRPDRDRGDSRRRGARPVAGDDLGARRLDVDDPRDVPG